ncbi:MAG: CDP-diacylglycerol--glycerol-3-phosphate 3-phosphatidyltransferase [Candidatus Omnitrophota bacterium]|jgi:CDP-diacylglycerol--glycerol-3-phosphate 3-phosphatidyltransferase|nr:MAG: CDP-diacylglycerol--glycerol-3-phosphate 3-phosphatidyltransferase [Candidatus Omnitrophota bacterium]
MKLAISTPNLLTSVRLILIPFIVLLLIYDSALSRYLVLFLVIISELTDLFDGILARKNGEVTDFGKILDPMADCTSHLTTNICLAYIDLVSFFLILPIIYRELIIYTFRPICSANGIVLAARKSGKIKAFLQATTIITILFLRIVALYLPIVDHSLYFIANFMMGITCVVTMYSAYDYLRFILPRIAILKNT